MAVWPMDIRNHVWRVETLSCIFLLLCIDEFSNLGLFDDCWWYQEPSNNSSRLQVSHHYKSMMCLLSSHSFYLQYTPDNHASDSPDFRIIQTSSILPKFYIVNYTGYSGVFERRLHFIWIFHQVLISKLLKIVTTSNQYHKKPSSERMETKSTTSRVFFLNFFTNWQFLLEILAERLQKIYSSLVSTGFIIINEIMMKILLEILGNVSSWLVSSCT